jgi:L-arabinonolactonase
MGLAFAFVTAEPDGLGESPLWDPEARHLFWVDALAPRIRALDPSTGATRAWPMPSEIGSIALAAPGHLLVALADGFYDLDLRTGAMSPFWTAELPAATRFNDGKADRDGGFVCGTMQVEDDAPPGFLAGLGAEGTVQHLAEGFGVTNAVCFSPDGATLYATDSRVGVLWSWPYRSGAPLGRRRVLADVKALTGSGPDGATVDAQGGIWTALVRTGQLARVTPGGRLDRVIDLPLDHPTCPAFGGAALDTLFVTSIARSRRLHSPRADAGCILAITGLGVQGLAETRIALPIPSELTP